MSSQARKFGTFEGVFTPSILTILGVILYLRLGWVVGTVGLFGAIIIILLSHVATITTGLSLSSMTTNVRIGHGGFYSLLSKSLGLEVAGAIGIPLYLSQTLGSALYIIGFTELFTNMVEGYDEKIVASTVLLALLIISYVSAKLAMKIQFVIMAVIVFSFIAMFSYIDYSGTGNWVLRVNPEQFFSESSFWAVFAIFFPAVTGIGSGAAMSGDLKDPKRSLPRGILTAVAVGLVIYIAVAVWYSFIADANTLRNNNFVARDTVIWPWAVSAGIIGATLSSALGTLVGAPRILLAMGHDSAVPYTRVFTRTSSNGEPRLAILFTAILVEASILLGNLDMVASLLTMFFLITYGMINMAVFIEKAIGIPSFRPSFNIPLIIPIVGALWCFIIMFLINPVFAGIAILGVTSFYFLLVRRGLLSPTGDVRHGLLNAIAEIAVKSAAKLPEGGKSWKPNLMIPIEDPENWRDKMGFIRDLVFPSGTLRLFSVNVVQAGVRAKINQFIENIFKKRDQEDLEEIENAPEKEGGVEVTRQALSSLSYHLNKEDKIFTANTVVDAAHFLEGISIVTQVMKGMFFPPNTMFLTMSPDTHKDHNLREMMAIAIREEMGLMLLGGWHKFKGRNGLTGEKNLPAERQDRKDVINLWLRRGSPNRNLALLTTLVLARNWNADIRLISTVVKSEEVQLTHNVLQRIIEQGRLPATTTRQVILGSYFEILKKPPRATLNVFGLPPNLDLTVVHRIDDSVETPALFLKDSGLESVLV